MVDLDSMEPATRECVVDTFHAYMECGLWASTDEHGEPLDREFDITDISPEAQDAMMSDVYDFLSACWEADLDLTALEPAQIGHDFWLTRNHHGAGFWDRGLGELGDTLTTMAHAYGGQSLYDAEDGQLYLY